MRDFKNPYYEGPHCVCCQDTRKDIVEDIIKMLEEQESACSDWVISLIKKENE